MRSSQQRFSAEVGSQSELRIGEAFLRQSERREGAEAGHALGSQATNLPKSLSGRFELWRAGALGDDRRRDETFVVIATGQEDAVDP